MTRKTPYPSPCLVVGLGNELGGDDAVGLRVAREVETLGVDCASVRIGARDLAGLPDIWEGRRAVILVDAVRSGAPPGTIHRLDAARTPVSAIRSSRCSTHGFGVGDAIELARVLDRLPESLVILGIEGEEFCAGARLSRAVERAVPEVLCRIVEELNLPCGRSSGSLSSW